MACDDHVVGSGAEAEAYAESIIKAAERSIALVGAPRGVHQLALFSTRHILERRIEMILNKDRVRVITRQWKYLILPAALIAVVAWMLIPGRLTKSGLAQPQPDGAMGKLQLVKSLADNKAYDDLIEMALRNPDVELRRLAAVRITEIQGDSGAKAMFELYNESDDPEIKRLVIDTFGRIGEIESLAKIALFDPSTAYQHRALERIRWLKENSDSGAIKLQNLPTKFQDQLQCQLDKLQDQPPAPLPPPPPPPPPGSLNVESGKPLAPLRWHNDDQSVFALLRQMADARLRRDTSVFEQILDDNYIGIGPDGSIINKAQQIADVKSPEYSAKKVEFDDLSVNGNRDSAIATFICTDNFEANGQNSTAQFRYIVAFTKRGGEWKVLTVHMSHKQ